MLVRARLNSESAMAADDMADCCSVTAGNETRIQLRDSVPKTAQTLCREKIHNLSTTPGK